MRQQAKGEDRRTCSLLSPIFYYALEVSAILLLAYIFSGADLFSKHGLVMFIIGAAYPTMKLPLFLKRAKQCNRYKNVYKSTELKAY